MIGKMAVAGMALILLAGGCGNRTGTSGRPAEEELPGIPLRGHAAVGAVTTTTTLVSVTYEDSDGSGRIDRGDTLTLAFDRPVDAAEASVTDLALSSQGDRFGRGAYLRKPAAPSHRIGLRLGRGPRLSIFDTYVPNDRPNRSPAAVWIVGEGFERIDLVTLGGAVAASSFPGGRWYYFRATQTDGDKLYAAPFFVDR